MSPRQIFSMILFAGSYVSPHRLQQSQQQKCAPRVSASGKIRRIHQTRAITRLQKLEKAGLVTFTPARSSRGERK